jgi:hypothetical protein
MALVGFARGTLPKPTTLLKASNNRRGSANQRQLSAPCGEHSMPPLKPMLSSRDSLEAFDFYGISDGIIRPMHLENEHPRGP